MNNNQCFYTTQGYIKCTNEKFMNNFQSGYNGQCNVSDSVNIYSCKSNLRCVYSNLQNRYYCEN